MANSPCNQPQKFKTSNTNANNARICIANNSSKTYGFRERRRSNIEVAYGMVPLQARWVRPVCKEKDHSMDVLLELCAGVLRKLGAGKHDFARMKGKAPPMDVPPF